MTEFLTQKNGVVCHHCFKTIDLTERKRKPVPKIIKTLGTFLGPRPFFVVTCPHCNEKSDYSYDKDVKPISESGTKEAIYQKRLENLLFKAIKGNLDAKTLAIEFKNIQENPIDDIDEDQTLPPNHELPTNKTKHPFGEPYN